MERPAPPADGYRTPTADDWQVDRPAPPSNGYPPRWSTRRRAGQRLPRAGRGRLAVAPPVYGFRRRSRKSGAPTGLHAPVDDWRAANGVPAPAVRRLAGGPAGAAAGTGADRRAAGAGGRLAGRPAGAAAGAGSAAPRRLPTGCRPAGPRAAKRLRRPRRPRPAFPRRRHARPRRRPPDRGASTPDRARRHPRLRRPVARRRRPAGPRRRPARRPCPDRAVAPPTTAPRRGGARCPRRPADGGRPTAPLAVTGGIGERVVHVFDGDSTQLLRRYVPARETLDREPAPTRPAAPAEAPAARGGPPPPGPPAAAGVAVPDRLRAAQRVPDPRVRRPDLLHPVRLDARDAGRGRPGAGQQGQLPPARREPRRRRRLPPPAGLPGARTRT